MSKLRDFTCPSCPAVFLLSCSLPSNVEYLSTPKKMNVISFANQHKVKWQPINIGFHWNESENKYDKNLEKCYEINRRPSTHDFVELDDATLRTRQEYLENYDHIAIDTGDIYHIDVDNLNMTDEWRSQVEEWKSKWPYYLSASKKLPHFLVKFEEKEEGNRIEPTITGKISKEWLYISMYDEQPVRDNYGALKIIFEEVPEVFLDRVEQNFKDPLVKQKLMEINKIGNILYVSQDESKPIMLAFHVYKTSKAYGITFIPFSINVSRDIRLYISQLKNKTYLFGKSAMSNFVSKMLYAAGIKKKSGDPGYQPGFNTKGAINLLRQAFVSRAMNEPSFSAVDKETLALAMKHSP